MTHETLINLTTATRRVAGNPDPSTIYRWSRQGVTARTGERIFLPLVRVGRRLFVDPAELDSFVKRLTAADEAHYHPVATRRAEERAEAKRVLDEAGIGVS